MKKIATLIDRELKWSQPRALKQEYALHAGEELAATLAFPSSLRSNATASSITMSSPSSISRIAACCIAPPISPSRDAQPTSRNFR